MHDVSDHYRYHPMRDVHWIGQIAEEAVNGYLAGGFEEGVGGPEMTLNKHSGDKKTKARWERKVGHRAPNECDV